MVEVVEVGCQETTFAMVMTAAAHPVGGQGHHADPRHGGIYPHAALHQGIRFLLYFEILIVFIFMHFLLFLSFHFAALKIIKKLKKK